MRGKIDEALELLRKNGYVYEKDGATWLRSTDFGDDKIASSSNRTVLTRI